MYARVTVSLPAELLERLDADAEASGVSRSELVQESIASYLGKTADEREELARRRRMFAALEGMRTFAVGREIVDDRPSVEILREIRATDDSAPLRDCRENR